MDKWDRADAHLVVKLARSVHSETWVQERVCCDARAYISDIYGNCASLLVEVDDEFIVVRMTVELCLDGVPVSGISQ